MDFRLIIGISGYARSGKDTAAAVLVEEFGFTQVAYADKLREALYRLDPMVSQYVYTESDGEFHLWGGNEIVTVQNVIDQFGWDRYKASPYGPEIRRLMQVLGTEVGRNMIGDTVWVDATFKGISTNTDTVITDVRFPSEAQAIADRGGLVIRITRPGVGPFAGVDGTIHPSETSLDDWDFDLEPIYNDGTVDEFRSKIRGVMKWLR